MSAASVLRLGADDYYRAALARLGEAQALYERGLRLEEGWAGCAYLAGRAVESLLRSLLWTFQSEQVIGHDLKDLRKQLQRNAQHPKAAESRPVVDAINDLSIVWNNNLRFFDDLKWKRLLHRCGRLRQIGSRKVTGDPLKANAKTALDSSEAVLSHLEPTCKQRLNKK